MMKRQEIHDRLKPSLLTLCLAALSRENGAVWEATDLVVDAVVKIVAEAKKPIPVKRRPFVFREDTDN